MRKIIVLISLLTIFSCGEKTTGVKKTVTRTYSPITLFDKVKIKIGMPKKLVEAKLAVITNYKITTDKRSIRIVLADSTNSYLKFNFNKKEKLVKVKGTYLGETSELVKTISNIEKRRTQLENKMGKPYDLGFLFMSRKGYGFNYKFYKFGLFGLNITAHDFFDFTNQKKENKIAKKIQIKLFRKVFLKFGFSKKHVKKLLAKLDSKHRIINQPRGIIVYFADSKESFFKLLFNSKNQFARITLIYYSSKEKLDKLKRIMYRDEVLRRNQSRDWNYVKFANSYYYSIRLHYSWKPLRFTFELK